MTPAKRINPITGKDQIWIELQGGEGMWMHHLQPLCERCKPFNECLDFKSLSDKEWKEVTEKIKEASKAPTIQSKILKELRQFVSQFRASSANDQPKKRIIKPLCFFIGKHKLFAGEVDLSELVIVLHKGKEQEWVREGGSKLTLGLEYGEDYILTFMCKGYITKKLRFITRKVPVSFQKASENGEIEPFHYNVSLEKQPVNELVKYNQPVAVISYNKKYGDFIYTANRVKTVKQKWV